jgi:hypothetical protein
LVCLISVNLVLVKYSLPRPGQAGLLQVTPRPSGTMTHPQSHSTMGSTAVGTGALKS